MLALKEKIFRFLKEEEGATATEYAVMLVLIIVVCLVVIGFLGRNVKEGFDRVGQDLNAAIQQG